MEGRDDTANDPVVAATLQSKARTRALARVIGPFLVVVPSLIAARGSDMDALTASFIENDALVWVAGGLLLLGGALIVAYHRYWSSPAAIFISLFGWALLARGVALLAVPRLIASSTDGALIAFPAMRLGYAILVLAGVWLTFVGWKVEPARSDAPLSRDR
jgi:hypothetical protein